MTENKLIFDAFNDHYFSVVIETFTYFVLKGKGFENVMVLVI